MFNEDTPSLPSKKAERRAFESPNGPLYAIDRNRERKRFMNENQREHALEYKSAYENESHDYKNTYKGMKRDYDEVNVKSRSRRCIRQSAMYRRVCHLVVEE